MAERNSGLRSILSLPLIYEAVQHVFGARAGRRMIVDRFIRPEKGDRLLDIGCGPATLLSLMPNVEYVGYDPNRSYIEHARKVLQSRGQFFLGRFTSDDLSKHRSFDIGLLIAVLHHLDDREASALLALLRAAIRPGGRLVTLDPVFIENQNPIARKLIAWDRGKNVRNSNCYRALVRPHFGLIEPTIIHKKFPPYTVLVMECS